MSEKPLPFVITDRRKFNADGQPRESGALPPTAEAAPSSDVVIVPTTAPAPASEAATPVSAAEPEFRPESVMADELLPPAPSAEQMEQSQRAFEATADRLETAIRAANPGAEHPPALTFESLVQSVYMQAVLQLGGGTQQGEQPQIDLVGAKQSIDMLGILSEKSKGNLSKPENLLLSSALFELRLAFLEMTQALARSAQQRATSHPGATSVASGGRSGPSLIR